MDTSKTPKEIFSADIQKDLLLLEEQEGSVNFKFGVVYMKSGQKVDDEMLSNGEFSYIRDKWVYAQNSSLKIIFNMSTKCYRMNG